MEKREVMRYREKVALWGFLASGRSREPKEGPQIRGIPPAEIRPGVAEARARPPTDSVGLQEILVSNSLRPCSFPIPSRTIRRLFIRSSPSLRGWRYSSSRPGQVRSLKLAPPLFPSPPNPLSLFGRRPMCLHGSEHAPAVEVWSLQKYGL